MSAVIVEAASVSIPLLGAGLSEADMAEDASVTQALRQSLDSLCRYVAVWPQESGPTFPLGAS